MEQILSQLSTSISELKKNPSRLIAAAEGETVAILNHNTPAAYLVSPEHYEALLELLDDYHLSQQVKQRLADGETPITISLDDL